MVLGVDTEPEIGQFRDLVAAKQHVFQFDVTVGHVDAKYEIPNGTDIIQQSQSNIYRNPSERGKQKKKNLPMQVRTGVAQLLKDQPSFGFRQFLF